MKFKLKNSSRGALRVLSVESDKGDELAYVDAERVCRNDLEAFLPMTYERGGKSYEFSYYLGTCVSLERLLRAPLSPATLRMALGSLLGVMQVCEEVGLSRLRIVFDSEYVYYDPALDRLRFAYVPVRSFASSSSESELVARVCRSSLADPNDREFAAAVWDFVHRTTILTSVAFEGLLRDWGLRVARSPGRASEPPRSAINAGGRTGRGWNFVAAAKRAEALSPNDGINDVRAGVRADDVEPSVRVGMRADDAEPSVRVGVRADGTEPSVRIGVQADGAQSGVRTGDAKPGMRLDAQVSGTRDGVSAGGVWEDASAGGMQDDMSAGGARDGVGAGGSAGFDALGASARQRAGKRVILTRVRTGERFALAVGEHLLGRSSECAVSLSDAVGVSRKHALLRVGADGCFLRDLRSTNGVKVDGKRLIASEEVRLSEGSVFSLGDERFVVG